MILPATSEAVFVDAPVEVSAPVTEDRVASLTAGMAAGRESAWVEFHAEYFDRLFRYLIVVCRGDEHAAREALQAALVRVSRKVRVFRSADEWWNWLAAVARSCVVDGVRKQSRYRALLERYAGWLFPTVAPAVAEDGVRLTVCLDECLAEIDGADRELLVAKYRDGESTATLAAAAGCSAKAMESRLARLRAGLKKQLLRRIRDED